MTVPSHDVQTASIGLAPVALARAFPFHFVVDGTLHFVQLGPALARLPDAPALGGLLPDQFLCLQPQGSLSADFLRQIQGRPLLLAHRRSHIPFRGHFDQGGDGDEWIFIGSPSLLSMQALEAAGLHVDDFAPHDRISDLLLLTKNQRAQMANLRQLKERLSRQHDEYEKSEEIFVTALAAANSVVYREDLLSDSFTEAGESFAKLTGHDFHALRPSRLRELRDVARHDPGYEQTGEINIAVPRRSMEYRFVRRDGSERWFSDDAAIILDARGREIFAVGLIEDITGRKRVEDALRESEERASRLARVVELTQNAVVITDVDGSIQWVNPGFTALSGYLPSEVIGKRPQELVGDGRNPTDLISQARSDVRAGASAHIEVAFAHRDGSPLWIDVEAQPLVDAAGKITGFMLVCMDITAQVQLEARLRSQRDAFNAILRLIPGGIVALDSSGRVTFCNNWIAQLLGKKESALLGAPVSELDDLFRQQCAPDDPPYSLGAPVPNGREVVRVIRPTPATLSRVDCEYRDEHGQRVWHVAYLSDITREAEIDEMKSQFLSVAAHELRTPMASIHGFSELLLSKDFDAETSKMIARTIHRQSSLLVDMVNELLDIARIEAGGARDFVISEFELDPQVREAAAALLPPEGPPRVEFELDSAHGANVKADPAKLRLTLNNVLSNGYKYSAEGTPIRIDYLRRQSRGAQQVGVRIADRGIGMTPDQLARVFERFYRADPSGAVAGTGLGMTLVKEIIEAMHGSVEIESLAGRGTTVTLWLPAAEPVVDDPVRS
jgi:PAS domain S-box-containing protein